MMRRSRNACISARYRAFCLGLTTTLLMSSQLVIANEKVGLDQIRLASSVGAQCSGYYDGLFVLMQNLEEANSHLILSDLRNALPGLSKRALFKESTASIMMTKSFIQLMNQTEKPSVAYTLESFREDYVGFRRQSMEWKNTEDDVLYLNQMRQQCERVLSISYGNGTLTEEKVSSAVEKRAKALGVELSEN